MKSFSINTPKGVRKIGLGHPCFIIAELSANHHQNYDKAVELIKVAAQAGADAIKAQTYLPDTLTIDCDKKSFVLDRDDNPGAWQGMTLYNLYKTAYTPWEWMPKLKKAAEDLGMVFFATSYDVTAVDYMEQIGVSCHKIASYEVVHIPLLKRVAKTGKPIFISVGYATPEEIELALKTLRDNGAVDIVVLYCLSAYSNSMKNKEMHLSTIRDIAERYGVVVGFSENTGGIDAAVLSVMAGASVLEKHFILDRAEGGPDADFSINAGEFKEMVSRIRKVETSLGSPHYGPVNEKEEYNKNAMRQTIFVVENIKKGEKLSKENIRIIRPGTGLAPKYYDELIGKVASQNIERGTALSWNLIKK